MLTLGHLSYHRSLVAAAAPEFPLSNVMRQNQTSGECSGLHSVRHALTETAVCPRARYVESYPSHPRRRQSGRDKWVGQTLIHESSRQVS